MSVKHQLVLVKQRLIFSWVLPNSSCQFWNNKSIPLQVLHHSSVSWKISPLYFFSSNNTYFTQKEHIKVKYFETFECSEQNLSNSLCQFWNKFASFFIFMTHNYSVNFKPIHFLLGIKVSHQSPTFETFKCSGENLCNSSCHFLNYNSVFLKTLNHSSVSLKITPLYFFNSKNIYFA